MTSAPPFATAEVAIESQKSASRRSARIRKQAVQGVSLLASAFLSYFVISHFFLQSVRVTGMSMQPTLHNSQHCFLNRWLYYVRAPQRGDIVVIRDPQDDGLSVKRIIAMAGDTVELSKGPVLLNGQPLKEPYLAPGTITFPGPSFRTQTLKCGSGEFVVLGDNRLNSADSRVYGPITRNKILGRIIP